MEGIWPQINIFEKNISKQVHNDGVGESSLINLMPKMFPLSYRETQYNKTNTQNYIAYTSQNPTSKRD